MSVDVVRIAADADNADQRFDGRIHTARAVLDEIVDVDQIRPSRLTKGIDNRRALTTAVFGNTTVGLSAPLGSFELGQYRTSTYTLFVIGVAIVVLGGVLAILRFTRLGLIARGTMQNANMAAALGVNPNRVYSITFGAGAALTGLAGAVIAPVSGVFPTIGAAYVAKSFITVIGGGVSIVTGTTTASTLFGAVNQVATYVTTPVFGEVALLTAAIVLIRVLPQGITGRFFRGSL